MTGDGQPPERAPIVLDLVRQRQIVDVGAKRASAFLKLGLMVAELPPPTDYSLNGGMTFQFWPNPVPPDVSAEVGREFPSWLVGSCLKELDLHFALFLDAIWETLELAKLHGQLSAYPPTIDRSFEQATNVASKLGKISGLIGVEPALDCFSSLSLARNSLTHGAGHVRKRDTNTEQLLRVTWIAPVLVVQDGDEEIIFRESVVDTHALKVARRDAPGGIPLMVRFAEHSIEFRVGERIDFTPHNLAEICFFYKHQASLIVEGVRKHLDRLGIPVIPAPTAEHVVVGNQAQETAPGDHADG